LRAWQGGHPSGIDVSYASDFTTRPAADVGVDGRRALAQDMIAGEVVVRVGDAILRRPLP